MEKVLDVVKKVLDFLVIIATAIGTVFGGVNRKRLE